MVPMGMDFCGSVRSADLFEPAIIPARHTTDAKFYMVNTLFLQKLLCGTPTSDGGKEDANEDDKGRGHVRHNLASILVTWQRVTNEVTFTVVCTPQVLCNSCITISTTLAVLENYCQPLPSQPTNAPLNLPLSSPGMPGISRASWLMK
jgi:hypothetical protein